MIAIEFTMPLWIAILAAAFLGERLYGWKIAALVVGFAAETEHLREHAAEKVRAKQLDLLVANDVAAPDSGFEVDTNRAMLFDGSGSVTETPLLSKLSLAEVILDRVAVRLGRDTTRESQ